MPGIFHMGRIGVGVRVSVLRTWCRVFGVFSIEASA